MPYWGVPFQTGNAYYFSLGPVSNITTIINTNGEYQTNWTYYNGVPSVDDYGPLYQQSCFVFAYYMLFNPDLPSVEEYGTIGECQTAVDNCWPIQQSCLNVVPQAYDFVSLTVKRYYGGNASCAVGGYMGVLTNTFGGVWPIGNVVTAVIPGYHGVIPIYAEPDPVSVPIVQPVQAVVNSRRNVYSSIQAEMNATVSGSYDLDGTIVSAGNPSRVVMASTDTSDATCAADMEIDLQDSQSVLTVLGRVLTKPGRY